MQKSKILVSCPKGMPFLLKQELLSLGFPILSETIAGIETEGSLDDTMQLNLHLRTGHRVLVALREFAAREGDDMYREVKEVPWEDIIPADGYVCVTSAVDMPSIRDSRFASVRCKDAIVDRIKENRGRRPDSGPERDRSVVHLYWKDARATVYLDTSGEPLSRRGYRKIPLTAPMQETLAAAVVLTTGWQGAENFINPMCGSGTLAIEAALIGLKRAPGLTRRNFGFMHVIGYHELRWRNMREQARASAARKLAGRIIATDHDSAAIEAAKKNATTSGVDHVIEFRVCDYADTPVPPGGGVIVVNPEYGERMGEVQQLVPVYGDIGDFLKQKGVGYRGFVFTGNPMLAKKVGLKARRTVPFSNSGIECRLLEYELYQGTRKKTKGRQEQDAGS